MNLLRFLSSPFQISEENQVHKINFTEFMYEKCRKKYFIAT